MTQDRTPPTLSADSRRAFGRRRMLYGLGLALGVAGRAWAFGPIDLAPASPDIVTVYRPRSCGCCLGWVEHLRASGFTVTVTNIDDLDPIERAAGVPYDLASCHIALVGGYVVEGHVPAASLRRLLAERPDILGLAVAGMPDSAPGMEIDSREPFDVIAFDAAGATSVYDRY